MDLTIYTSNSPRTWLCLVSHCYCPAFHLHVAICDVCGQEDYSITRVMLDTRHDERLVYVAELVMVLSLSLSRLTHFVAPKHPCDETCLYQHHLKTVFNNLNIFH
jgi:hypothetical protein